MAPGENEFDTPEIFRFVGDQIARVAMLFWGSEARSPQSLRIPWAYFGPHVALDWMVGMGR